MLQRLLPQPADNGRAGNRAANARPRVDPKRTLPPRDSNEME